MAAVSFDDGTARLCGGGGCHNDNHVVGTARAAR